MALRNRKALQAVSGSAEPNTKIIVEPDQHQGPGRKQFCEPSLCLHARLLLQLVAAKQPSAPSGNSSSERRPADRQMMSAFEILEGMARRDELRLFHRWLRAQFHKRLHEIILLVANRRSIREVQREVYNDNSGIIKPTVRRERQQRIVIGAGSHQLGRIHRNCRQSHVVRTP